MLLERREAGVRDIQRGIRQNSDFAKLLAWRMMTIMDTCILIRAIERCSGRGPKGWALTNLHDGW